MTGLKSALRQASLFQAHPVLKKVHFNLSENTTRMIEAREETAQTKSIVKIPMVKTPIVKYPALLNLPKHENQLNSVSHRETVVKQVSDKVIDLVRSLPQGRAIRFIPDVLNESERQVFKSYVNQFAMDVARHLPKNTILEIDSEFGYYPAALAAQFVGAGRYIYLAARREVELLAIVEMINPGVILSVSSEVSLETRQLIERACQPGVTTLWALESDESLGHGMIPN